jgi:cytochrome c oxidase assembly protein subunit 15
MRFRFAPAARRRARNGNQNREPNLNFMTTTSQTSPWLHRLAVLTVCATLPLLVLGAEVTTKQVGMVDPEGFREPWHLLRVPLQELGLGFLIEHSHRLAGFIVGTCVIVLAVSLWLREPRRWLRWLGLAALLGVSVQGILGGLRVNLNVLMGNNLALIHGCFAQLIFALLVSLTLFTSRGWQTEAETADSPQLRRWSLLTVGLVYGQAVLGAVVRHKDFPWGARAHLIMAFAVVAAVVWLVKLVAESHPGDRFRMRPVLFLVGLVCVQVLLGVESWMSKFSAPEWRQVQPLTAQPEVFRSLHYFVGALVFATAVVVTLQAHRQVTWSGKVAAVSVGRLEGAA